jgi:hypothetical protein
MIQHKTFEKYNFFCLVVLKSKEVRAVQYNIDSLGRIRASL